MNDPDDRERAGNLRNLAAELDQTMALVDELVREIRAGALPSRSNGRLLALAGLLERRPDLTALPGLILEAYAQVADALGGIQRSREAIAHYSFGRFSLGHARLSEVTQATESATLELLNGLDRSLALVDAIAAFVPDQAAQEPVERLRHEVNELYGHLQFQDITAQQLAGMATRLEEIEARVRTALCLFECGSTATAPVSSTALSFNPEATFEAVESRQAIIDAEFARRAIDQEVPIQ